MGKHISWRASGNFLLADFEKLSCVYEAAIVVEFESERRALCISCVVFHSYLNTNILHSFQSLKRPLQRQKQDRSMVRGTDTSVFVERTRNMFGGMTGIEVFFNT